MWYLHSGSAESADNTFTNVTSLHPHESTAEGWKGITIFAFCKWAPWEVLGLVGCHNRASQTEMCTNSKHVFFFSTTLTEIRARKHSLVHLVHAHFTQNLTEDNTTRPARVRGSDSGHTGTRNSWPEVGILILPYVVVWIKGNEGCGLLAHNHCSAHIIFFPSFLLTVYIMVLSFQTSFHKLKTLQQSIVTYKNRCWTSLFLILIVNPYILFNCSLFYNTQSFPLKY